MQGYKVFKPDWTCRGFQYVAGETFEEDVIPLCCNRGFHFCKELKDYFNYYPFDPNNKVAKVIALGEIDESSDSGKCCTNKIQIVEEISWEKVLKMVNTGKANVGLCNSGNRNSGDWNKTNFSSGCFNTKESKILMFNKPSDWTLRNWYSSEARCLLSKIKHNAPEWICSDEMTDEEKKQYPEYETTGGYLKKYDESECGQIWWSNLSNHEKDVIKELPNFDAEIFEQVTGVHVE